MPAEKYSNMYARTGLQLKFQSLLENDQHFLSYFLPMTLLHNI